LARAKGISAGATTTVSDGYVIDMIKANKFNPSVKGHWFAEVYLANAGEWIVADPTARKLTGQTKDGYYVLSEKKYQLFERGLDPWDVGIMNESVHRKMMKARFQVY
jgi:hypothetical protein